MLIELFEKNEETPCLFPFKETSKVKELINKMRQGNYEKVKLEKKILTLKELKTFNNNINIYNLFITNNIKMTRMTNIDAHVGIRLKLKRIELGFSQKELANSLSLTFQQIQKYEKGVNRISAGNLYKISHFLKVPIKYFFEDLDKKNIDYETYDSDSHQLKKEILTISRLLNKLENEEKRKYLINVIKDLIKFLE